MLFHEISKECYKWVEKQYNVKEESLTDWLLYQASLKSNRVLYKAFTRNEEAHNGADWEWWILTKDCCGLAAYRFLVQAKKLKHGEDNYNSITYGNRNGMQIDLLLSSAVERQALPLYAYYINSQPDIEKQLINFSFIKEDIIRWCETCVNGVYLSSAMSIRKQVIEQPKRKITEKELINNSLGLSLLDLLFKENSVDENIPYYFFDVLNKHFSKFCRNGISVDNNYNVEYAYENRSFRYSHHQFPKYLSAMLQSQGQNIDWLENEFYRDLEGVSGVAIIDTRIK